MKLNTSKCKKKLQWENEVTADPIDLCGATTKIWVVVMCNNPDLGINFPTFPLAPCESPEDAVALFNEAVNWVSVEACAIWNDVHSEED